MASDPILPDPTPSQLAAAVEGNLVALFRAMAATLPGGELVEGDRLSYHHAFPANPMFKGVWRTRLAPEETDGAIAEALAWFEERGAPFAFWWMGPGTTPADLGDRLAARGFVPFELEAPGMAADLARLDPALLDRVPPGFAIEEVGDAAGLEAFERVFVAAYGVPEWAARAWVEATVRVGVGRTPWQIHVGRLDGEPVAATILFAGGGVASVYGVGTVPAARGRGIGAAITVKPLLAARERGYRHAVLFSTELGRPVYERIGFRDCGARISRYLWRAG
jgi:GNAT superfamily N-acetyltransferase